MIAVKTGSRIEDVKFACLHGAPPRRAAPVVGAIVVAKMLQILPRPFGSFLPDISEHLDLIRSGTNRLLRRIIHCFGDADSAANRFNLVIVFVLAQPQDERGYVPRVASGQGEDAADAASHIHTQRADVGDAQGQFLGHHLVLTIVHGGQKFGLVGNNLVSGDLHVRVGSDKRDFTVGAYKGSGGVVEVVKPAGEIVDVWPARNDGPVQLVLMENLDQALLSRTTSFHCEFHSASLLVNRPFPAHGYVPLLPNLPRSRWGIRCSDRIQRFSSAAPSLP